MATKQKFPLKRRLDDLKDINDIVCDTSEVALCKAKRRKNDEHIKDPIKNTANLESKSQLNDDFLYRSQQKYGKRQSQIDQSKCFPVTTASNSEKNGRRRFKKLFASAYKPGSASEEGKTSKNLALINNVSIKISKDIACRSAEKNYKGKAERQVVPDPTDTMLCLMDNNQLNNRKEGNVQQKYYISQTANSHDVHDSGEGSIMDVQSSNLSGTKMQISKKKKSLLSLIVEKQQSIDTEPLKERSGSEISNVSSSCVSQSHNPVLKPNIMGTGIAVTATLTCQSASTSATSTPIMSLPVLTDGFQDISRCGVGSLEHKTLTSRREDGNHTEMSSQQRDNYDFPCVSASEIHEQKDDLSGFYNVTVCHNQEIVSFGKNKNFSTATVSSINGSSGVKEEESIGAADDEPVNNADFYPLNLIKSNVNPQQPGYWKVHVWGDYMLKNLELFYKEEKYCDFILKFHGGEVLKVHRTILLACTSLLSGPDAIDGINELLVPEDLEFASVEPIIRFVYSGHLSIQKSDSEMRAIYAAAKRLKIPLLMQVMEHHFPYLFSSCIKRITTEDDTAEHIKEKLTTLNNVDNAEAIKLEDCVVQESSIYYVVPNLSGYSPSNNSAQVKSVAEEARPTRIVLEEDSETLPVTIASWNPKCSPTVYSPLSLASHVSTPPSVSSDSSSSILVDCKMSETCSIPISSLSHTIKKCSSNINLNVQIKQPTLPGPGLLACGSKTLESPEKEDKSVELIDDSFVPKDSYKSVNVTDFSENHQTCENEHNRENNDLMEKISSICKQLEENESDDAEEKLQNTESMLKRCNLELCIPSGTHGEVNVTNDSITPQSSTPVKSILKKKKVIGKKTKHVSFVLDKNNEVINEVAKFSLFKEPSQSIIGVEKVIGNLKSGRDTCSSVQLTVSMKKKVLRNLSLSESETLGSPNNSVSKSRDRKNVSTSDQNHSKSQVSKGDINNHAKLISEVLKKYPHLVKDKKNIRLKVLKKSSEKDGEKTKSKVQYLMLTDKDAKSKPQTDASKALSLSKDEMSIPKARKNKPIYECPECNGRTFHTYFMLKKHVTCDHQDKGSVILSHIDIPYACFTCFAKEPLDAKEPLEFVDYYSYQQHMKDVHSRTELRLCNMCGFKPARKLELAYHQYTQHNKVSRSFYFPKCDLCDHVAINDAALLKHRSQHTNADDYTCSVCGVKFCSFGALQGHMQTKLCGTMPNMNHKCPFCPLTFTRSYNLKAHCKSSHRSQQTTACKITCSKGKKFPNVMTRLAKSRSEKTQGNYILKNTSNSNYEGNNTDTETNCETSTDMPSSEAEALSSLTNSLITPMELSEETLDPYMYPEVSKKKHTNTVDEEKDEQVISQPVDLGMHVESPCVSEYQDISKCYDKSFSPHTSMQCNTSLSTLFPTNVVPSEVVSNHIVPGQIIPSHLLSSGCMNSSKKPVLGKAPQSWTCVPYQVPYVSEDLPVILTETTSIKAPDKT